ncbi:hypothetical protein HGRIS_001237 [Hohenbuehelia grisea]|uniref:Uncharacterized protein n=1 Tax=Hohenbuehelia grisea TaxID=104357 RepID=A0ABR3JNP8_9AGAR
MGAIAAFDGPRLRHLINQSLNRGESVKIILARLNDAITQVYHAKGYTQSDVDIASLVLHLGGRKCLFAVSKALGLPCVNTVAKLSNKLAIIPSTPRPTATEIHHNIEVCFPQLGPTATSPIKRSGYALMMDNISLRHCIRVLRSSNKMVGVCREHGSQHDLSLRDFENVAKVHEAVHGDTLSLHYGREATVVAFAPLRGHSYHPLPLLVSPTCKAEKAPAIGGMVRLLMSSWHEEAASVYGVLWLLATDGDAAFRLACHRECSIRELDYRSPIAKHLLDLPGLNLNVGAHDETYTSDPKHCWKRVATLLRRKDGVVIKKQIINRAHLQIFPERLPNQTAENVRILIDPTDHQNVPRAVKLFQAIDMLESLDRVAMDPLHEKVLMSITVLREVINCFLQPFILPQLSLSQQLTMLPKAPSPGSYTTRASSCWFPTPKTGLEQQPSRTWRNIHRT